MFYHYSRETKEFIGESIEEGVFSTNVSPSETLDLYETFVFNELKSEWEIVKDYRKANDIGILFDKTNGNTILVDSLGDYEGYTPIPCIKEQNEYCTFNDVSKTWNEPKKSYKGEIVYNKETKESLLWEEHDLDEKHTEKVPLQDSIWENDDWVVQQYLVDKRQRNIDISNLTVEYKDTVFQADDLSVNRMVSRFVIMTSKDSVRWKDIKNNIVVLTKANLKELITICMNTIEEKIYLF